MSSNDALFTELDLDILYEGWGQDILDSFVRPVLKCARSYDRLTGFFTVDSLLAVADGIDALWRKQGTMRLIVGIHDVPHEILEAERLDAKTADEMVEEVRRRLLEEVSSVQDEFARDRLATLAWMMNDGLLEIRIACPVDLENHRSGGIFHNKRMIFRDTEGNTVVGVGSPNETGAGMQGNIEELSVFTDWEEGQRAFVQRHTESFENIWNDNREYLTVVELDVSFANELLDQLDAPKQPPMLQQSSFVKLDEVLEIVKSSPAYSVLSFDNVGLYPHQERVVVEALSRWPIRVLLADEVGLGKTLEAGAILTYLLEFADVDKATILAPANLLKQWQEELKLHFGLDFWRWDSTQTEYISPTGKIWNQPLGGNPVGPAAPSRVLISAQLARGTRQQGHIYEDAEQFPDVMLVDEAHAARVRPTLDGLYRPTRLWRLLDDVSQEVAHLVFMTATPLQTNLYEYHSLLRLLGLPELWDDSEVYKRSLEILSGGENAKSLQNARWILRLLEAVVNDMEYTPDNISPTQRKLLEMAKHSGESPSLDAINEVMKDWSSAFNLLVKLHPAHLLTLRNNRSSLVELGYRFPERRFESPALDIPLEVNRFYDGLHEYLREAYGSVEEAADPNREISLGFTKSSYHQRTASSLNSAICSLENRLNKIDAIVEGYDTDADVLEEEYEEPDISPDEEESLSENTSSEQRRLERAKSIELTYIKDLIGRLENFVIDGPFRDPKMDTMVGLLSEHLPEEGVLVFSRYTDTLDACLEAFRANQSDNLDVGYGLYTGQDAWITTDETQRPATKQDVKLALEDEDIRVVFCSEAAAEGLNLQAARVMINIDVPWNPAKLEQRIGRIARLGQTADEVVIYNLWYPDSVEAKMYTRLTERKDLYDIAVGQSPEIVSNAIRSRVVSRDRRSGGNIEEAIANLGEIRQSVQHAAIQKVWGSPEELIPLSTRVRRAFLEVLAAVTPNATLESGASSVRVTLSQPDGKSIVAESNPEDRSVLTLHHEMLQVLSDLKGTLLADEELFVVEDSASNHPIGLCLKRDNSIAVIPPASLPQLVSRLINGESMRALVREDDWVPRDEADIREQIYATSQWLPNHALLKVPFNESDSNEEQSSWSEPNLHIRSL
ncbi:helicase-related protein [Haladaptatus sp. DYSN1]|uniref:helicase-related protein n=1 Tax=unclassified Haladaptatus TaxID=2622732 RepID=UPI002405C581|nr:helicase-related protein [Haladaptatus sp. DYSN1]